MQTSSDARERGTNTASGSDGTDNTGTATAASGTAVRQLVRN